MLGVSEGNGRTAICVPSIPQDRIFSSHMANVLISIVKPRKIIGKVPLFEVVKSGADCGVSGQSTIR